MKIYKTATGAVVAHNDLYYTLATVDWDTFINRKGLYGKIVAELKEMPGQPESPATSPWEPPMESQEIWASGVTYMRSKEARMEESKDAGGGTFYDRVYDADRPELFFKALKQRTVGHQGRVRIRKDSVWNVPEPELTLFISSEKTIEGYTIGNDMSSRSIEGENPLYLPQAKSYDGCAALGPCLLVLETPIATDTQISLEVIREGAQVFFGEIGIDSMKRVHTDLVDYLFRECSFPQGVFLMTGTGIIPPDAFTLHSGDEIRISIAGIGTLVNTVA